MVLAMGYVPNQVWQQLYEPADGLHKGTIFRQLDLPFEGGRKE
ncbi:MAG: spore coat associated protein CotJA [Clostridia bacterium]|nr:spore coat associated protein CotJA [Clostridia bacterium]